MNTTDEPRSELRTAIAGLNNEMRWGLSQMQILDYALAITKVLALADSQAQKPKHEPKSVSDAQILTQRVCIYYHQCHKEVQVLQDTQHPLHNAYWEDITKYIASSLRKKLHSILEGHGNELDDLVQEVMIEISLSIHKFMYQSRLRTWVYKLAANTALRKIRDSKAKKRKPALEPKNIDDLALNKAEPSSSLGQPEAESEEKDLLRYILQILVKGGRPNTAESVYLRWQGYSPEEIGAFLRCHPSWVRRLLREARELLRQHPEFAERLDLTRPLSSAQSPATSTKRTKRSKTKGEPPVEQPPDEAETEEE